VAFGVAVAMGVYQDRWLTKALKAGWMSALAFSHYEDSEAVRLTTASGSPLVN
jgi:hypothetical protein